MTLTGPELRAHPRFPLVLQVQFRGDSELRDFTENLSAGGLFVRTDRPLQVGEKVQLSLSFSPLLLPVTVEVLIVRRREAAPDLPAGVAVRVIDNVEHRATLARLAQLMARQTSGAQERYRVLLVEDNTLLGGMYADAMRELTKRTTTLAIELERDGAAAMARLSHSPDFDAIICDRHMPKVDGLQLLAHVRATSQLAHLPFILVSGANDTTTAQAKMAGADVFLRKPLQLQELVFTVETLLRSGPSGRKATAAPKR